MTESWNLYKATTSSAGTCARSHVALLSPTATERRTTSACIPKLRWHGAFATEGQTTTYLLVCYYLCSIQNCNVIYDLCVYALAAPRDLSSSYCCNINSCSCLYHHRLGWRKPLSIELLHQPVHPCNVDGLFNTRGRVSRCCSERGWWTSPSDILLAKCIVHTLSHIACNTHDAGVLKTQQHESAAR